MCDWRVAESVRLFSRKLSIQGLPLHEETFSRHPSDDLPNNDFPFSGAETLKYFEPKYVENVEVVPVMHMYETSKIPTTNVF